MRTRFLYIDYFDPPPFSNPEHLTFLNLPVPLLCNSPQLSSSEGLNTCCFDSAAVDISIDIDKLPIDGALSKFFSNVFPHLIDLEIREFLNKQCKGEEDCQIDGTSFNSGGGETWLSTKETEVHCDKEEVVSERKTPFDTLESEYPKASKSTTTFHGNAYHELEAVQFETPLLDLFLENATSGAVEGLLSQVPEIESNLDVTLLALQLEHSRDALESMYAVKDITLEYHMEQKVIVLEDAGYVQGQHSEDNCTFPSFEVDEIFVGIPSSPPTEEEHLLLEEINFHPSIPDYNLQFDEKLLGSVDIDMPENIPDYHLKHYLEADMTSLNSSLEMDFISNSKTTSDGVTDSSNSFILARPVLFHVIQFPDFISSPSWEGFLSPHTNNSSGFCEQSFSKDMNKVFFDELIVAHELALADHTFKCMPVPILSDYEGIAMPLVLIEAAIARLKPLPLPASDGIYLDWCLLEEGECNHHISSTYQNLLEEVKSYSSGIYLQPIDYSKLVYEFVFGGDSSYGSNIVDSKEELDVHSSDISMHNKCHHGNAFTMVLEDACSSPGKGVLPDASDAAGALSLFPPMSKFNDLDFFLNPGKAVAGEKGECKVEESNAGAMLPMISAGSKIAACDPTVVQPFQWDIEVHQLRLSDDILVLIDNFQKSYLAILKNDMHILQRALFLGTDNIKLLGLRMQKLVECIKEAVAVQASPVLHEENVVALIALTAIKQMSWYLCYSGIHTTYLYIDKLCQSLDFIKCRLSFLWSLVEDACKKADKEITRSHPLLHAIHGILCSNTTVNGGKVLIVAEKIFWPPLQRLLTSMRISFNELHSLQIHSMQPEFNDYVTISSSKIETLLNADCLLISHEHVSQSFPFGKFNTILEYGGSHGSSRISVLAPKLDSVSHLHFLKVELDDYAVPKALCEGVDMLKNTGLGMEGAIYSILGLGENMNHQKLEELLKNVPLESKFNTGSSDAVAKVEACCMPLEDLSCSPLIGKSNQTQPTLSPLAHNIVIVNTQNLDKDMVISRRSTYQRILAMEKEGTQIIERDSNLPLDIIISASVCLVWYERRNIGRKTTTADEASSGLSMCVENIATNVLTLLSFSFSGCILVFEGEAGFLASIMELSDVLYAAAASLGIDLQLFYSYSSELTEEIIHSSISKLMRGLYPKMPESETLAEAFLTKIPSISPLSAHAILSSGSVLSEFFELSLEGRIKKIENYHVPEVSVALLSALCKYGEREDSKSGMTDCSSSVPSDPDSRCFRVDSDKKKHKISGSTQQLEKSACDTLCFEPLNQFMDGSTNPSGLFASCRPNGPNMTSESNKGLFGQKRGLEGPLMNRFGCHGINKTKTKDEDQIGEVIDINNSSLFGENFYSDEFSPGFTSLMCEVNTARSSKTARRLSFGGSSHPAHPTFPTAFQINHDFAIPNSENANQKNSRGGIDCYSDREFPFDYMNLTSQGELMKDASTEKSTKEKDGVTPLSKAVCSTQLQRGSPWTIEFLNRIKEKSKLRHRSLPCETPDHQSGYSGNISRFPKRKSPSIFDLYRHQGGSTPKKIPAPKRQKCPQPSTLSKNDKVSAASCPTWTPVDKRARQTLSFATNGSGSQTRLVWGDRNPWGLNKRYRK